MQPTFTSEFPLEETAPSERPADQVATKTGMGFAYASLVLFMCVYFGRPEDWIPGIASVPLAKLTGFLVIGSFIVSIGAARKSIPRFAKLMLLLLIQFSAAIVFSIFKSGSLQIVQGFVNVAIITVITVYVATTEKRLNRLFFVQTVALFAMSVLSVYRFKQGVNFRGRMEGVLGGVFENPNDLALNLAIVLPLALAFLVAAKNVLKKFFWMVVAVALVYTIMLSASRGGFLAMSSAMVIWLWYMSIKDGKKIWLALVLLGAVGAVIAAPSDYAERLSSITDADKDVTGSSHERQLLLARSAAVTAQNPLFGVGPGNFQVVSGNWHVSHNAYLQLASEDGIPAFIIFVLIIWDAFRCVNRARELIPQGDNFRPMIYALKGSLAALMVGAIFTNISYHYYPYFLFGYCTAALGIERDRRDSPAPAAGEALEYSG